MRLVNAESKQFLLFYYLGWILLACLILAIPVDFYFYDDVRYLQAAKEWAENGLIQDQDVFAQRLGFLFPYALLLKLFPFISSLLFLINKLFFLGLLYLIFRWNERTESKNIALWSLVLCAGPLYHWLFAARIYPDMALAFWVFAAVFFLVKGGSEGFSNKGYAILAAALFFMGFMVKETWLLLALPMALFVLLAYRKNWIPRSFLNYFILASLGLFTLYVFLSYLWAGSFFYRLEVIQAEHYVWEGSYFDKGSLILLKRLTFQPYSFLVNSGLAILFVPACLYYWLERKSFLKSMPYTLLLILGLGGWLVFCFISTRWDLYNPMPLQARHILLLSPFWALAAGHFLASGRKRLLLAFLLGLVAFWAFALDSRILSIGAWYTVIVLFFIFSSFQKTSLKFQALILLLLLWIHPLQFFLKQEDDHGYAKLEEALSEWRGQWIIHHPDIPLLTDTMTQNMLWLMVQEGKNLGLQLAEPSILQGEHYWLLNHPNRLREAMRMQDQLAKNGYQATNEKCLSGFCLQLWQSGEAFE